jgi:1,4-dihydroxy-2-naphthoyl-CoA hydrolase
MSDAIPVGGLPKHLGIEFGESGPELATASLAVGDHLLQPYGVVHGGVHAALAETVCSRATMLAVQDDGMVAMGQSNHATFVRPVSEGQINARATPRHRGRTTWIWDCEISDDEGRLCALVRMTIAVRPNPAPPDAGAP